MDSLLFLIEKNKNKNKKTLVCKLTYIMLLT